MAQLRFHWDFFGPDAEGTAHHFVHHLEEFCAKEGVAPFEAWTTREGARHVANLECDEAHMALVRDRLRPKRAERLD